MKVRVSYLVEATDELRRAINLYYNLPGLASRVEVQKWYEMHGDSMNDDLMSLLENTEAHG